MGRVVSRSRQGAGRGLGERISELAVFAAIIVVLVMAGRWYFFVHLRSPGVALSRYISAVDTGNVQAQYELLSASTKQFFGSLKAYEKNWPIAHNLAARVSNYNVTKMTEKGDKATAEVTVYIRKTGQELYQTGTDTYEDRYELVKEADGWKIVLEKSDVKSIAAVPNR